MPVTPARPFFTVLLIALLTALVACGGGDEAGASAPLAGSERRALCEQVDQSAEQIAQLPPWPEAETAADIPSTWAAGEAQIAAYRIQAEALDALRSYLPEPDQRQEAQQLSAGSSDQADYLTERLNGAQSENRPLAPSVTLALEPHPLFDTVERECGTAVEEWLQSPGESAG